ncbi:hypothetical protein P7C70_g3655, partial [Phenoliferia sp. Uapishka_3]
MLPREPDGANDVFSSLHILIHLQLIAPTGVDVLTLASDNLSTASSWIAPPRHPHEALSDFPPPLDDHLLPPRTKVTELEPFPPPSKNRTKPLGPRELEAYELWHLHSMAPEQVATQMSSTRTIKGLSVMFVVSPISPSRTAPIMLIFAPDVRWHVINCVARIRTLPFDDRRLLESLAEVSGEEHPRLLEEHGRFIAEVRSRIN